MGEYMARRKHRFSQAFRENRSLNFSPLSFSPETNYFQNTNIFLKLHTKFLISSIFDNLYQKANLIHYLIFLKVQFIQIIQKKFD